MMEFRILGPVGLWSDDEEIPLNGTKQRTMLAALLLAGGRVLPDYRLGEALWGEKPPETFRAQIYTYASRLRPRLKHCAEITRKGSGYLLRILSGRLDYTEFQDLSRRGYHHLRQRDHAQAAEFLHAALDLWCGPALTDATEYLRDAERPSLEEVYMKVLEGSITAGLALGQHLRLTSELVGLVHAHPMRERLRAQLMVALYASDRQADAFAVFHEGRRQLKEELGVAPGATLQHAYQAILTGSVENASLESWLHPTGQSLAPEPYSFPAEPLLTGSGISRP